MPPYRFIDEDSEDFEDFNECGFISDDGCPYCSYVSDGLLLTWLINKSGKTREDLEKEYNA